LSADGEDSAASAEEEPFECPNTVPVGIFSKHAHPGDCRQYFVCISGTPREYGCPLGTVFKVRGPTYTRLGERSIRP
jgi:hypothetical protein